MIYIINHFDNLKNVFFQTTFVVNVGLNVSIHP